MNKLEMKSIIVAISLIVTSACANAQGLSDILKGLGGDDSSSTIQNIIEGVFTKTDLTLEDIVGSYESTGPAVSFKSDNLLQKAGGVAGAAAIETKLEPYFKQYGLTGLKLEIKEDATFSMNVKGAKITGEITPNSEEGTFIFNFKVAGMKLGKFTAYIQKSGSDIDLMFDASKLKQIISAVASVTGNTLAKTCASILDSYDGACIGFKMKAVAASENSSDSGASAGSDDSSKASEGINALKNILNKKK